MYETVTNASVSNTITVISSSSSLLLSLSVIFSSARRDKIITGQKLCLCVNQGGKNHNRYMHRLVILHAQSYWWTLITELQATNHSCEARPISTLRNFVVLGPIITKLGRIDYVKDPYSYATFSWIWLGGEFPANRWNITYLWLFVAVSYTHLTLPTIYSV